MARKKNGRDAYDKAQLMLEGAKLPYEAQVAMRTRRGALGAGYLNKLGRQQRKCVGQLKSENCGPKLKDWQRGW